MKRFLIVIVALLSIVITNASETETTTTNKFNIESSTDAPIYWQGWAHENRGMPYYSLYITVYRTANQCDAYYAIASKLEYTTSISKKQYDISQELIVKTANNGKYYVTYDDSNFYFNM